MMSSFGTHQIYLAQDTIDMRKSINGLITIMGEAIHMELVIDLFDDRIIAY